LDSIKLPKLKPASEMTEEELDNEVFLDDDSDDDDFEDTILQEVSGSEDLEDDG
jgi:hypothetical protein